MRNNRRSLSAHCVVRSLNPFLDSRVVFIVRFRIRVKQYFDDVWIVAIKAGMINRLLAVSVNGVGISSHLQEETKDGRVAVVSGSKVQRGPFVFVDGSQVSPLVQEVAQHFGIVVVESCQVQRGGAVLVGCFEEISGPFPEHSDYFRIPVVESGHVERSAAVLVERSAIRSMVQ